MAWLHSLLALSRSRSHSQPYSGPPSYSHSSVTSASSLAPPPEKHTPLTEDALSQLPRHCHRGPYSSHSQQPRGSYSSNSHSVASSRAPLSRVSTPAVSTFDVDSSSEPSTGITTPDIDLGQDKKGRGPSIQELDKDQRVDPPPSIASCQLERVPSGEAAPRTAKDDCPHREIAVAQSVEVPCSICGSREPGRLLVCTNIVKPAVDANIPHNLDEGESAHNDPVDCAVEDKDAELPSPHLSSPFFKNLTPEELAKSSNLELMAMIIERNPEHADSRCQIHSAITALRAPPPKPAGHKRSESTESEDSSPEQQRCGYVVCVKCESRVRSTAASGPETDNLSGAGSNRSSVVIPTRSSSLSTGTRGGLGGRRASDQGSMKGRRKGVVTDWAVYHHGLQGDGWRIPRGTRPRNKLRVPRKLKVVAEEDEKNSPAPEKGESASQAPSTPSTSPTPVSVVEERATHATAHGLM